MKYWSTIIDNANFLMHLLLTLPLQQEVATEAALTLIPHTVVLTAHTHSIFLSRAFCCPLFNLRSKSIQWMTQALHQDFICRIQKGKTISKNCLHSHGPVDSLLDFPLPSDAPLWTDICHCFLCRIHDRGDTSHLPRLSQQTTACTFHSADPKNKKEIEVTYSLIITQT